jgi:hypothetical protein
MNDEFGTDDRSAALDVIVDGLIKRINSREDPAGDIKYVNQRLNKDCFSESVINKAVEIAPEENCLTVSGLMKLLSTVPEDYTVEFRTDCHIRKLFFDFYSDYVFCFNIFIGSHSEDSTVSNLLLAIHKRDLNKVVRFRDNIGYYKFVKYDIDPVRKSIVFHLNEK